MKLKLDENIHGSAAQALAAAGHDVASVHQQRLAGSPDVEIAKAVKAERRCLVTSDLGFADTRRYPPGEFSGLVILRLRHRTMRHQLERIAHALAGDAELTGRLWIVEDDRVRDWTPDIGGLASGCSYQRLACAPLAT